MNLLFILLSAVATFTIESKTSVNVDGSWPYDMEATYANTYKKGQVPADAVATLTVSGLGGIVVESVEVYVKSNKTSGAGTFTVTANNIDVATKTGTFEDWFGAYDNETFHALSLIKKKQPAVQTLSVTLTGITNSLTIEKYVITWSQAVDACKVTLMNDNTVHATLTETTSGAGVVLPTLPDLENWRFAAWTEEELEEDSYMMPESWIEPGLYHPVEDCTLWAVYCYIVPPKVEYISDLESGTYFYVNRTTNLALMGVPENGIMASTELNLNSNNQKYRIDFVPTQDTAYITHAGTQTPIGYNAYNPKMEAVASPWLVYHDGEETLFYAKINNKSYVLWLNIQDKDNQGLIYAGLYQANPGPSPMSLCRKEMPDEQRLSCHPNGKQSIFVTPQSSSQEFIVPFGIYELHIKDGQKTLYIR